MAIKIAKTRPTVINILGADEAYYFCHSSIIESWSILPILCFGNIFYLAFVEWVACSNASEAFLPALFNNTIGPPGC